MQQHGEGLIDMTNEPTPNERIVRDLFWDERALDWLRTWALTRAEAESIILHDTNPSLDPHSSEAGHPIVRFKRGDVIVVVGLREHQKPKVLSVFVIVPGWEDHKQRTATSAGPGSSLPKTHRQLKEWIIAFGYSLKLARNGHFDVVDKASGDRVCQIAATPSDNRTIANDWRRFLHEHTKMKARMR